MTQANDMTANRSDDRGNCDAAAFQRWESVVANYLTAKRQADLTGDDKSCMTQDWDACATTGEMEAGPIGEKA